MNFCCNTFELVMSIIILVQYYGNGKSRIFRGREQTYIYAMVLLILYGLITAI